jgi:hypothetical protein
VKINKTACTLTQLAASEPKYLFLFAMFALLKVINHLAHENQKGSLASNQQA